MAILSLLIGVERKGPTKTLNSCFTAQDLCHDQICPRRCKHRRRLFWSCSSVRACYPEGNFGRNQLLDGSISLSPLFAATKIDLHVRSSADLQPRFLWPSSSPRKVHHLSGLPTMTLGLFLLSDNMPCHRRQLLGPCFKTGCMFLQASSYTGNQCPGSGSLRKNLRSIHFPPSHFMFSFSCYTAVSFHVSLTVLLHYRISVYI